MIKDKDARKGIKINAPTFLLNPINSNKLIKEKLVSQINNINNKYLTKFFLINNFFLLNTIVLYRKYPKNIFISCDPKVATEVDIK